MTVFSQKFVEALSATSVINQEVRQLAAEEKSMFIRSQHQVSPATDDSPGHHFTLVEVLESLGMDVVRRLNEKLAVPIVNSQDEPLLSLKRQAICLNINLNEILFATEFTEQEVSNLEVGRQVTFHKLSKLAKKLGLFWPRIGSISQLDSTDIYCRFRSKLGASQLLKINPSLPKVDKNLVDLIAYVSTVFQEAEYLRDLYANYVEVYFRQRPIRLESSESASVNEPGLRGISAAQALRRQLNLGFAPIKSMSQMVETRMGIDILKSNVTVESQGFTIDRLGRRYIFVNGNQEKLDVFGIRISMAHELCHAVVDDENEFKKVAFGNHTFFNQSYSGTDAVEQRANAFAVEFIAPIEGIKLVLEQRGYNVDGLAEVCTRYGISPTAAQFHIGNNLNLDLNKFNFDIRDPHIGNRLSNKLENSTRKWMAFEQSTSEYVKVNSNVPSENSAASIVVAFELFERGLISSDSLARFLGVERSQIANSVEKLRRWKRRQSGAFNKALKIGLNRA